MANIPRFSQTLNIESYNGNIWNMPHFQRTDLFQFAEVLKPFCLNMIERIFEYLSQIKEMV